MIYIHIPFCDSKCYYCNFSSGKFDKKIKQEYFKKLNFEIQKKVLTHNLKVGQNQPPYQARTTIICQKGAGLFHRNKKISWDSTHSTAHDILFGMEQRCAPYHKKLL